MVLWDLLEKCKKEQKLSLVVGHVEHGLRGRASREDAAFVQKQAQKYKTPCYVMPVRTKEWAEKNKRGLEESARILRYQALARLAAQTKCQAIVTAHHQNDQVETIFLHLIRGTGPGGMAGMCSVSPLPIHETGIERTQCTPVKRVPLIRPLLSTARSKIWAYLTASGILYRKDSTNQQSVFFRNRIRPVLAQWEKARPGFFDRVCQLADIQRDEEDFWQQYILRTERARRSQISSLELKPFLRYHKAVQRRILKHSMGLTDFATIERVRALAKVKKPKQISIPEGFVEKTSHFIVIHKGKSVLGHKTSTRSPLSRAYKMPVPGQLRIKTDSRCFDICARVVRSLPSGWKKTCTRVFVDAEKLKAHSLRVRFWQPGDKFKPLGIRGHKKLQDFFTDQKIPFEQRGSIPLLVNSQGIVWIVGHRMSNDVKITTSTRKIVEIKSNEKKGVGADPSLPTNRDHI